LALPPISIIHASVPAPARDTRHPNSNSSSSCWHTVPGKRDIYDSPSYAIRILLLRSSSSAFHSKSRFTPNRVFDAGAPPPDRDQTSEFQFGSSCRFTSSSSRYTSHCSAIRVSLQFAFPSNCSSPLQFKLSCAPAPAFLSGDTKWTPPTQLIHYAAYTVGCPPTIANFNGNMCILSHLEYGGVRQSPQPDSPASTDLCQTCELTNPFSATAL
jgi:hypothetical protein